MPKSAKNLQEFPASHVWLLECQKAPAEPTSWVKELICYHLVMTNRLT